jgi:subtilisin family serine protease
MFPLTTGSRPKAARSIIAVVVAAVMIFQYALPVNAAQFKANANSTASFNQTGFGPLNESLFGQVQKSRPLISLLDGQRVTGGGTSDTDMPPMLDEPFSEPEPDETDAAEPEPAPEQDEPGTTEPDPSPGSEPTEPDPAPGSDESGATEPDQPGASDSLFEESVKVAEFKPEPGDRGIIVRYRDKPGLMGLMSMPGPVHNLALVPVGQEQDIEDAIEELLDDPNVEYAEPNYELHAQDDPNDPEFDEQWALNEIDAVDAWDEAYYLLDGEDPAPVIVAVIDTGVDSTHEDLENRVLPGHNAITGATDITDAMDDSFNGHGTHIAGIIAANTNNDAGVAGTAGQLPVSILPVKVLDRSGTGTMYDVAMGIYWAADWEGDSGERVRVINLSLGARLPDYPKTLADAVRYAQDQGILVIAAAGNENGKNVEDFFPACLPGVVHVAATGKDHALASFSNYSYEDVKAPGVDIISTLPGNSYGRLSGTSQSAAFASGIAAIMWSVFPEKSANELAAALKKGYFMYSGKPVLNAQQALRAVETQPYDRFTLLNPKDGSRVSGTVDIILKADNPAKIDRVEFYYLPDGYDQNKSIIGTIDQPPESGIFSMQWDTTQVEDGRYWVGAWVYHGKTETIRNASIMVANNQQDDLVLEIKKPGGEPAPGARVTVHHAYPDPDTGDMVFEELWNNAADLNGKVMLPGSKAIYGNDFVVTAQGTEPNFFYYRVVRSPGHIVIDDSDAQTITVSACPEGKEPLSKAVVLFEMLEGNLQGSNNPEKPIKLDYYGYGLNLVPLATLNADGKAEVTLTRGLYNLRLMDAQRYYNLMHYNVQIQEDMANFDFLARGTASLKLAPDGEFLTVGLLLQDKNRREFTGFDRVKGEQVITVSPGIYTAEINATCLDSGNDQSFIWTLEAPTFELEAGENRVLLFGGSIKAEMHIYPEGFEGYCEEGNWAEFDTPFPDSHHNRTISLYRQSIASLTEAGQGSSGILLRIPGEGSQTYSYNEDSRSFEPAAQASVTIRPALHIEDSNGTELEVFGFINFKGFEDYYSAAFLIPDGIVPDGEESTQIFAWSELDAGILAPTGSNGIVKSQKLELEVRKPDDTGVPGDGPMITLQIKNLDGQPEPYVENIVLMKKQDEYGYGYIYDEYYGYYTDDVDGNYYYDHADPGDYMVAVCTEGPDPGDPGNWLPMFMFKDFHIDDTPITVMLDASQLSMKRITLKPHDKNGKLIKPRNGFVVYQPHLNPVKFDGSEPYRLEASQNIAGTSHADRLGYIITYRRA